MSDPIDLGRPFICLIGGDLDKTAAFYRKLGFTSQHSPPAGYRLLRQGTNSFAFFDFYTHPNVNYRGASIHAIASELTNRSTTALIAGRDSIPWRSPPCTAGTGATRA